MSVSFNMGLDAGNSSLTPIPKQQLPMIGSFKKQVQSFIAPPIGQSQEQLNTSIGSLNRLSNGEKLMLPSLGRLQEGKRDSEGLFDSPVVGMKA